MMNPLDSSSPHAELAKAASKSPWRVFAMVAVAVFLVSLDSTIVLAAFPSLRDAYQGVSAADLSWVLNAYTIVYAALLVPSGRMADAFGRRRVFLVGLGVFGIASALGALAPNPLILTLMRALQAVGAAALTPASLALILVVFPLQKRAMAVGLWGAMGALAAAVGPSVGGWLVQWAGWQSVFWVNVPIVIWSLWRARHGLDESRVEHAFSKIDFVGILLLISGIGTLIWGLLEVGHWQSEMTISTSLGGIVLLALFALWANGKPSAAMDTSLFKQSNYAWANATTLVFGATFSMMFLGLFLFLTGPWKFGPAEAGLWISPGPLMVVPVAVLAGRLAGRVGHRPLMVTGGLLFAASQWWLSIKLGEMPDFWVWAVGLLMSGVSVGLVLPALSGAAVARLEPQHFGVGNAANSAIRQIGGAFGAAVAVLLVGEAGAVLAQFKLLYQVMFLGGLATALLSLPIETRPTSETEKNGHHSVENHDMRGLNNRIPPPFVFAAFATMMGIVVWMNLGSETLNWWDVPIGMSFFVLAAISGPPAVWQFMHSKTTINPIDIDRASMLVTEGVYRWTRNPMYLSMASLLAAFAAIAGQPWLWLGPVLFVAYIQRFQILPEEKAMSQLFGSAYQDYRSKVRRWL